MKYLNRLWIAVVLLTFSACQQDEEALSFSGLIVKLDNLNVEVDSRATPSELSKPLAEKFTLYISDEKDGKPIYKGNLTSELINVSPGTYTVKAFYGNNAGLAIDAPYYEGRQTGVTVEYEESKHVSLTCKVANSLLSVRYANAEIFNEMYTSYGLLIKQGSFSKALTSTSESMYFPAGKTISVFFEGTLKSNGQKVSHELKHTTLSKPLQPGEHLILTLKTNLVQRPEISKAEIQKVTINATIPMDWLPKPKIEATGFDAQQGLEFVETESKEAKLTFKTAKPIQDMKLSFNIEDARFAETFNGKEYLLSTMTQDDRAAIHEAFGIRLPKINSESRNNSESSESTDNNASSDNTAGNKNAEINLAPMIDSLQTNAGATTTNTISINVKANNRWLNDDENGKATYTLKCVKPQFKVNVSNGSIWTKEFTVSPMQESDLINTANFEKITGDIKYQISENNQDWNDISTENLLCNFLTPGKEYYVRSLYRGEIASEVTTVATYDNKSLPNGNLEDWIEKTRNVYVGANLTKNVNKYAHYPILSSIWACVNQKTFESTPNIESSYNIISSTSRVKRENGYAAQLKTVGWDNGLGNTGSIIYHIAAGKLFIGTYEFIHKDNKEMYNYGMEFSGKPTAFKFIHKYKSFNNDQFKAWIVLENREEAITVVGKGEVIGGNQDEFTEITVPITYTNDSLKITHMYIVFSSSSNCSDNESIESGNLKGMTQLISLTESTWYGEKVLDTYHQGSVFTIDDITLVYDK